MDTSEDDEIGSGLFGRTPPDLTALVELLRSDRPISDGIRDMLAEMIDPDSNGYLYLRLKLVDIEGKVRNQARDVQTLEIAAYHEKLKISGKSSNKAAIETGEKYRMEDRRVYSRLQEAKALLGWLKGKR